MSATDPSARTMPVVQPDRRRAGGSHGREVVRDEQQRRALVEHRRGSAPGSAAGRSRRRRRAPRRRAGSSGSRCAATAEAEPHLHAGRVELDLAVDGVLEFGEGDDLVEAPRDLAALEAHDRAGQVDVLPAGQQRLRSRRGPRSARRPGRRPRRGPAVGYMTRERIFSSVDLPAPLAPTSAQDSPGSARDADVAAAPSASSAAPRPAGDRRCSAISVLQVAWAGRRVGTASRPRAPSIVPSGNVGHPRLQPLEQAGTRRAGRAASSRAPTAEREPVAAPGRTARQRAGRRSPARAG